MPTSARRRTRPADVARYYADLTSEYEAYGGSARTWNYGVWEADVRSHQAALQRGKEWMVRGLAIGPETRILDVGCGAGGFGAWCASSFGCRVTGITICDEHLELAQETASEAGVGQQCQFLSMDMDALDLPPASFDVVTNQESFCCAQNKPRYLRAVFRILAPGGTWSSIDFNVRGGRLSAADSSEVQKVLRGFHIPSLLSLSAVLRYARAAGFEDCTAAELGAAVLPTAALIMRRSHEPLKLARRHPRTRIHSPDRGEDLNVRGHFEAGMSYSVGLHTGLFEHGYFRARKPGGVTKPQQ
jgi:cyclopropane fatty-acyl-phospholipid synthase-like methyltransferase